MDNRQQWFDRLVELVDDDQLEDGGVMLRDSDPGADSTTAENCGRYAVFQREAFTCEQEVWTYDTLPDLQAALASIIDGESAGEDYGWQVTAVHDLETRQELQYKITIEVTPKVDVVSGG